MTIRVAIRSDYPAICAYLEQHWRPCHPFTRSHDLFAWQHGTADGYNFVLGCAADGAIQGVLGFIPASQFDPVLESSALWLAIWSVCDSARGQGLGGKMLSFIEDMYKPTLIGTNGATEMTLKMYRARGWTTGVLEQWYATVGHATIGRLGGIRGTIPLPAKTAKWVENRYEKHPVYKYTVIGNGHTTAVLRVCENEATRVRILRVVDLIGPSSGFSHLPWRQLIAHFQCKMIDFTCAGVPPRDLEAAGFKRRRGDEVIVPRHFEPYEHRNVDVAYAIKAPRGLPWRICVGDSDMDRPNLIPECVPGSRATLRDRETGTESERRDAPDSTSKAMPGMALVP